MPKCAGCGNEMAANAGFCSICGRASVGGRHPGIPLTAGVQAYSAPSAPNRTLAYVCGALAVAALGGFIALKASGVLGAKQTVPSTAAVLSAPQTEVVQAPVLSAPTVQAPNAPVIQAPVVAGSPMPEDVIAYLRWLKSFETARRQLEDQGYGQLSAVLATVLKNSMTGGAAMQSLLSDDPTEAGSAPVANAPVVDLRPIDATIRQWNQAASVFQQKTPPNAAAALASAYNGALSQSVSEMASVTNTLRSTLDKLKANNGQGTPDVMQTFSGLQAQRSSKQGSKSVDAMYTDSNSSLDALRNQYTQVPADIDGRNFQIKVEAPSGGAIPGFGI